MAVMNLLSLAIMIVTSLACDTALKTYFPKQVNQEVGSMNRGLKTECYTNGKCAHHMYVSSSKDALHTLTGMVDHVRQKVNQLKIHSNNIATSSASQQRREKLMLVMLTLQDSIYDLNNTLTRLNRIRQSKQALEAQYRNLSAQLTNYIGTQMNLGCKVVVENATLFDVSECSNNGNVTNGTGGNYCTCALGWTGLTCDTIVCANNGTAINNKCNCTNEFMGTFCEILRTPCTDNPCMNGGTCSVRGQSYTCNCTEMYTGPRCNASSCMDPGYTCLNGTCSILDTGNYGCVCQLEFKDPRCGTQIEHCQPNNPCLNGGTCQNNYTGDSYTCNCTADYTGQKCDIALCGIDLSRELSLSNGNAPVLYLESDDFPYNYPNDEHCTWYLTTSTDSQIWLAIQSMNIEYCPFNCACDSLSIVGGSNNLTLCGSSTQPIILSQNNDLTVSFKSDNAGTAMGFKAAIHTANSNCSAYGLNSDDSTLFCDNGGTCLPSNDLQSFSCICTSAWKGKNCTEEKTYCDYYSPCKNGATCTITANATYYCNCSGGFEGRNCTQAPRRDCADLYTYYNILTSGVYNITLSMSDVISVYCDMGEHGSFGGGWTVFQKRQNATLDFSKPNWGQYEAGFGDVRSNFWLGNKYLNLLTNVPGRAMKLHVDLWDCTGDQAYEEYSNFVIDNAAANYKLHVTDGSAIGNANDGITVSTPNYNINGAQFYSPEQSVAGVPCTTLFEAGWWYNQCTQGNLNAPYQNNCQHNGNTGFSWIPWEKGNTLQRSEMKIRPSSFKSSAEESSSHDEHFISDF